VYKPQIYQIWWIESIGSENRIETFLPELECSSVQCSHRLCLPASHHCFIVQFAAVVMFACFPAVSYALTLAVWLLTGICPLLSHSHLHTHTHTQSFNGPMSGTTRVGRYQKKHLPTHTHPVHQTSFINFLHLLRSIASSFFKFTRLTILFRNLCPRPFWSFSWSRTLYFILHTCLHPIIIFSQHMPLPSQPVLL